MNNKDVVVIDNKRFLIIEKVEYKNSIYAYLINSNDEKDTMFVELKENAIKEIPKELLLTEVYPLFVNKFSEE